MPGVPAAARDPAARPRMQSDGGAPRSQFCRGAGPGGDSGAAGQDHPMIRGMAVTGPPPPPAPQPVLGLFS
eukprot:408868-Hanusia_phi.AAC.1